jgi:ribosomal protein L37E
MNVKKCATCGRQVLHTIDQKCTACGSAWKRFPRAPELERPAKKSKRRQAEIAEE